MSSLPWGSSPAVGSSNTRTLGRMASTPAIELEKVGLAAPQVTYIMHDLAGRGIPVRTDVTTVAEAADEILRAVGS